MAARPTHKSLGALIAVFFLAAILAPVRWNRSFADEAGYAYARALDAIQQERFEQAETELRDLLTRYPQSPLRSSAIASLAEALERLDREQEAVVLLDEALKGNPSPDDFRKLLPVAASVASKMRDLQRLSGYSDRASRELPDDPIVLETKLLFADRARELGRTDLAQPAYEAAFQMTTDGATQDRCRLGLADCHTLNERYDEAENIYRSLIAKKAGAYSVAAEYNLGTLLIQRAQVDQAMAIFSEFIREHPDHEYVPRARFGIAWVLFNKGSYEQAAVMLRALGDDPTIGVQSDYWLGVTLQKLGDLREAETTLRRAMANDKTNALRVDLALRLAEVLSDLGEFDEASRLLGEVERYPNLTDAAREQLFFAQVYWANCRADDALLDQAVAAYVQQFSSGRSSRRVALMAAESRARRGRYNEAHAYLKPLVESFFAMPDPKVLPAEDLERGVNAVILDAVCLVRTGQVLEGLSQFDRIEGGAFATRSQRVRARLESARALVDAKEAGRAVERLAAALSLTWTNDGAVQWSPRLVNDGIGRRLLTGGAAAPASTANAPDAFEWTPGELDEGAPLMTIALLRYGLVRQAEAFFQAYRERDPTRPAPPEVLQTVARAATDAGLIDWANELRGEAPLVDPPAQLEQRYADALAHYNAGRWSEAAEAFRVFLDGKPSDEESVQAKMLRGDALLQIEGGKEAALGMFEDVRRTAPRTQVWAKAAYMAARQFDKTGLYEAAIVRYRELLDSGVQSEFLDDARYNLAWDLKETGDEAGAAREFERLRADHPTSGYWAHATLPLVQWAYRDGDLDTAARLLDELKDRGTDKTIADRVLYYRAQIAAADKNWPLVKQQLRRILEVAPNKPIADTARCGIAEADYQLGDAAAALTGFETLRAKADQLPPEFAATVLLRIARIKASQANPDWYDVEQLTTRIKTLAPDFTEMYEVDYLIGRRCRMVGLQSQALSAYRRVLASPRAVGTETAAWARLDIGKTLGAQGHPEEALDAFNIVIEECRDHRDVRAKAIFLAAETLANELKRPDDALRYYEKLLREYPSSPDRMEASERIRTLRY